MSNKKIILMMGVIVLIIIAFYITNQYQTKTNTEEISLEKNTENNLSEIKIREKILNIINGDTGRSTLYDYSISPNKKYALVTLMTPRGSLFYSLFDLENKKDLFDSYTVAGQGELNNGNYLWTDDNKLILASQFNGHGGEGFDGILVVDLTDQSFYRLIDMTNICPQAFISNCMGGYSFEIKSIVNNSLTYKLIFNSYSIGHDPSFSYDKEETVSLR
jgi:hypothetical protein